MRILKYIIEIQLTEDIHHMDQSSLERLLKSAARTEAECQIATSNSKLIKVTTKQVQ